MPCSCSRCTSRSRCAPSHADSAETRAFHETTQARATSAVPAARRDASIDLQRSDGRKPCRDGMKIRTGPASCRRRRCRPVDIAARGSFAFTIGLLRWRLPRRVTLIPRNWPSGKSGTLTLRMTGPTSGPAAGPAPCGAPAAQPLARRRQNCADCRARRIAYRDRRQAEKAAFDGAATVPEYRVSSPRFAPSLTPDTTMSCSKSNSPEIARCTQSVGVH